MPKVCNLGYKTSGAYGLRPRLQNLGRPGLVELSTCVTCTQTVDGQPRHPCRVCVVLSECRSNRGGPWSVPSRFLVALGAELKAGKV